MDMDVEVFNTLFVILGIVCVVLFFGVLPFLNYYLLPFNRKEFKKDEEGKIILSLPNQAGISSFEVTDKGYVIKRTEGVERLDIFLLFKRGILVLKKHFYVEFATDEVVLPKPKKGKLFRFFVTKVDGRVRNSKQALGVSKPLLLATFIAQIVSLFLLVLIYAIFYDLQFSHYFSEISRFYVLPILIALALPTIFFIVQMVILKSKKIRKEVK